MSEKNNGGPAYPSRGGMMFYVPEESRGDVEKAVQALDQEHAGMSLRDYFAAKALQGLLACSYPVSELGYTMKNGKSLMENGAIFAYEMADAMLAERAK